MSFKSAASTIWPWGKHKGETIEQIAKTDEGLKYLDYMLGELEEDETKTKHPVLLALRQYLGNPAIAKELENAR